MVVAAAADVVANAAGVVAMTENDGKDVAVVDGCVVVEK